MYKKSDRGRHKRVCETKVSCEMQLRGEPFPVANRLTTRRRQEQGKPQCKKKETKMREKRKFSDYFKKAGRLGRRQIKKRKRKRKKKLSIRLKGGEEKMSFAEPCKPRHTNVYFFFFSFPFSHVPFRRFASSREKKKPPPESVSVLHECIDITPPKPLSSPSAT